MAFSGDPGGIKKLVSKISDIGKNAPADNSSSGFRLVKDVAKQQAERASLRDTLSQANFRRLDEEDVKEMGLKKGGVVKSSASKRADGIATKGKTRGKMV